MSEKRVYVTRIFEANYTAAARTVVNVGGARSTKSYSLAQLLIMRAVNEPGITIGVTRKTMASQYKSSYRLFISLLKEYSLYAPANHSKAHFSYNLGLSRIDFFGMDDPEKVKSTEYNLIWMEEASEFDWDDYLMLTTRLSARPAIPGAQNRLYLSLNPDDAEGWIAKRLLMQPDVVVIHSTYKDNPFLDTAYRRTLEQLKEQDENAWRVYACGEWGSNTGRVYTRYALVDSLPENVDEMIFGLDFGFNNPTALVRVAVKDSEVWLDEILYESGLTNSALCARLRELLPHEQLRCSIYADAAEPARIEELCTEGFLVYPADKAVLPGIDTVKSRKLHVTKRSLNLIKELRGYSWRRDKNGNSMDEPVKFNDHALDAVRYAVRTHFAPRTVPEVTAL